MLDHVGIKVSDFENSKAFYVKALAPLGLTLLMEVTPEMTGDDSAHAGFGRDSKPGFWISNSEVPQTGTHIAFTTTRDGVRAFHAAAIAAGGRDNGAPGPRAHYHPGYYGAFVLDPDGHNVEAVCHQPEG